MALTNYVDNIHLLLGPIYIVRSHMWNTLHFYTNIAFRLKYVVEIKILL